MRLRRWASAGRGQRRRRAGRRRLACRALGRAPGRTVRRGGGSSGRPAGESPWLRPGGRWRARGDAVDRVLDDLAHVGKFGLPVWNLPFGDSGSGRLVRVERHALQDQPVSLPASETSGRQHLLRDVGRQRCWWWPRRSAGSWSAGRPGSSGSAGSAAGSAGDPSGCSRCRRCASGRRPACLAVELLDAGRDVVVRLHVPAAGVMPPTGTGSGPTSTVSPPTASMIDSKPAMLTST